VCFNFCCCCLQLQLYGAIKACVQVCRPHAEEIICFPLASNTYRMAAIYLYITEGTLWPVSVPGDVLLQPTGVADCCSSSNMSL
jgi:hypothetical protein